MALARWQATIQDGNTGKIVPNAQVEVRQEIAGSPLARLFSDRQGTVPAANPITADANGYVFFHVTGGAYRITATKGGFTREWRYVGIGRNQESDLVGLRPAGEWDIEHAYDISDFVMFSSLGFVSKQSDNLGNEPPTAAEDNEFWMYVPLAAAEAELAREKAQEWAEEDENVPVETGKFSAKHHALKAAASATSAATSKTGADTAKTGAETAKTAAETARDASFVNAQVYADEATGRAAVANGAQFAWLDGNEVVRSTRVSSTVSTEVARFPTSGKLTAVFDDSLTTLSGYAAAFTDADGLVYLAVKTDGAVEMPATPTFNATQEHRVGLSGVVWAVTDQDDRIGLGVTDDGDPIMKGIRFDPTDLAAANVLPTDVIDCWGDSLTHGNTTGVTTPFPSALASLLGAERTVNNRGLTGQTSNQIATRMGAKPSLLTVAGNTIPTSGAVSVTVTENGNFGSKSNLGTRTYQGTLFGIHGTLSVAFNASDGNLAGTSSFTRTESGAAVLIPDHTPLIPDTNGWEDNIPVIWSGRNDVLSAYADPTTYSNAAILANIDLMVGFLSPLRKRFIILGVIDQASEYATAGGTAAAAFAQILALNLQLAIKYPRNFIDVRKILVNSYNPGAPADVTAFGRNQVPPSLQQDGLHLNNAGYAIVAQAVYNFIIAKGW